jgi:hypothetical protein
MACPRDEPVSNASDHSAQLGERKHTILMDATVVTNGKSPLPCRADRAHQTEFLYDILHPITEINALKRTATGH